MRKFNNVYVVVISMLAIVSCGPSEEQKHDWNYYDGEYHILAEELRDQRLWRLPKKYEHVATYNLFNDGKVELLDEGKATKNGSWTVETDGERKAIVLQFSDRDEPIYWYKFKDEWGKFGQLESDLIMVLQKEFYGEGEEKAEVAPGIDTINNN
ncbi:MAG: hypothetical protein NWS18_00425 [Schleiferiaceae bacterium]|jgi:hypothetical protein|nr:hypothetical protein [Schleiferiaceae bacterium]MDP4627890.1 hypothetical protein [Schleiferiaceae bacterium]MDP4749110.1 hypothetical protein [Schleiferiaceae bacterium]MDP4860117.1 hypothetical protein [Schleiferiaceae bacterium]